MAADVDVVVLHEHHPVLEVAVERRLVNLAQDFLPRAIGRVGLAGEHDLDRARWVREQLLQAGQVVEDQAGALVGREPARKPDGQRLGIEGVLGRRHQLLGIVVAAPLLGEAAAHEAHHVRLEHAVGLPQLRVRDRVDLRPHPRVGEMVAPVGAHVLGIKILHGRGEPGAHVHAVGDVTDRHLVLAVMRPEHLPGLPGDAAVQRGDAVRVARHLERQHGHAQRLPVILGADAPEAQELVLGEAERAPQRLQVIVDQLGREAIVAGVDGGVGGEHRALGDLLRAGPEIGAGQLHEQARVLQGGERAVAFVQVQAAPVDAGGAQRAHAAHAQQQLLPDADALIAEVKPGGELAVLFRVAVHVGVQQQQLVATDGDLPHLRPQGLPRQRDLDDDRLPGRGQRRLRGKHLRRRPQVFGVLPAVPADALPEIRLAVEEADRHQRQAQVGRALEMIARQHAQAARVDGQRFVDAELRGKISDRADAQRAGMHRSPGAGGAEVVAQFTERAVDPRAQRGVAGQVLEAPGGEAGEHGDRVVVGGPERLRIEVAKQLDDVRVPGPPQVARQLRELTFELLSERHGAATLS